MSKEAFERIVSELLIAIDLCLTNGLRTTGLLLLYASIDIMAWLSRPKEKSDVTSEDFIWWVNEYLLPNTRLPCSAEELWAARCGLIHSYAPESKHTRTRKVRKIFYAFSPGQAEDLQKVIDRGYPYPTLAVQAEDLFGAYRDGIEQFKQILSNDLSQARIVYKRAGKSFKFIPLSRLRGGAP